MRHKGTVDGSLDRWLLGIELILDVADQFLKSHKAGGLDTYVDSNIALVRAFGAYGLPVTVLIDPQGKVVARAEGGADWSTPEAIAYFKQLTSS